MAVDVEVPDIKFAGFYYPQWLDALILWKRQYAPELTDENPYETAMQLLRAFALVGHYTGVLTDISARECFITTARLLESFKSLAALVAFPLSRATPSAARLIAQLTSTFSVTTLVVPVNSLFATEEMVESPVIYFEVLEAIEISRTDEVIAVLAEEAGSLGANQAAKANTPSDPFSPWATPAVGDKLYIAHEDIMEDKVKFTLAGAGADLTGVWEYYDGDWRDEHPDAVTNMGTYLKFDLDTLLGTSDRSGARVRVEYSPTGEYEEVDSVWNGGKNIINTSGLLGQTTPSTDTSDYLVGVLWHELPGVTDGTSDLTASGDLDFTLPEDDWIATVVGDLSGYFIRYRIISVGGAPASPSIDLIEIDQGFQYLPIPVTQGRTTVDDPLGSSTGEANQKFPLSKSPLFEGNVVVEVDEGGGFQIWTEVDSFINSTPASRHYRLDVAANDIVTVIFGDGVFGKIPTAGTNNIKASYRIGGENDGNVGANTIIVNKSGVAYLTDIHNPIRASGWQEKDGADDEGLNSLRLEIPASVRAIAGALKPADVEYFAVQWIDTDGSSPVFRAIAIEEAYGPKSVEVVVVGAAGAFLTAEQRDALELYFNGDPEQKIDGILLMNHEATVVNYEQKIINVNVEVTGGTQSAVENAIAALLTPLARDELGDYRWDFGGEVPRSIIIAAIHEADPSITKVNLITPAADVSLTTRELPVLGTLTVTML